MIHDYSILSSLKNDSCRKNDQHNDAWDAMNNHRNGKKPPELPRDVACSAIQLPMIPHEPQPSKHAARFGKQSRHGDLPSQRKS